MVDLVQEEGQIDE